VEKLEYDSEVKIKLIERLNGGLYEELEEFLSNPLLATIMLLTFDHSADIPTKLTSFYQQAFEALYQRHDAAKGAYKRDHHAGLPIDRFQSVFSTFSFQTYINYKLEFSDEELISALRNACDYNQDKVDPQLLIRDTMESVCLIQKEGLDNIFSHRSFQEYFCALFISKYREADIRELIEAIASMENRSNVLRMLYELAPEAFEYEWVLPALKKFLASSNRVRPETKSGLKRMFSTIFDSIIVGLDTNHAEVITWQVGPSASEGSTAKWMSIIQSVTHGEVKLLTIHQFSMLPIEEVKAGRPGGF
jgi:predicted NACHT family NTPase